MSETQEKLVRAERLGAIEELSGSISHELHNPLNVIMSSTFYLRRRCRTDEKVTSHLDRVERNVERADNTINDLLSFARTTTPSLKRTMQRSWSQL